jgi:hypothetical protein
MAILLIRLPQALTMKLLKMLVNLISRTLKTAASSPDRRDDAADPAASNLIIVRSSVARPARCNRRRRHLLMALDVALDVAFDIPWSPPGFSLCLLLQEGLTFP